VVQVCRSSSKDSPQEAPQENIIIDWATFDKNSGARNLARDQKNKMKEDAQKREDEYIKQQIIELQKRLEGYKLEEERGEIPKKKESRGRTKRLQLRCEQ
jgi:hypothetical protein